ncbi:MAG: ribonuclease HII [Ruminococcus sp.]|nr:ribonuclease HII [Ruminococcus sp.]
MNCLEEKQSLFAFDSDFCTENGITLLAGTDEAGRGPLAGDVFAAAVILPLGCVISGIDDSKKLSEKKREMLFDEITQNALAYAVARASVDEIEELNILGAAKLSMKRAVSALETAPQYVFVDGNKLPDWDFRSSAIIGGDGKSAAVAAASILAKVSRDRYMKEIAALYPEYEFEKHKGYGTKLHYEKIREYGACPIHRPSFLKKIH